MLTADAGTPPNAGPRRFTRATLAGRSRAMVFGAEVLRILTAVLLPLMIVIAFRAAEGLSIDGLVYRTTPLLVVLAVLGTLASLPFRLGRIDVFADAVALHTIWDVLADRRSVKRVRVLHVHDGDPDDRLTVTIGRSVYTFGRAAWPDLPALAAALRAAVWRPPEPDSGTRPSRTDGS